jgi:hypothetical protein
MREDGRAIFGIVLVEEDASRDSPKQSRHRGFVVTFSKFEWINFMAARFIVVAEPVELWRRAVGKGVSAHHSPIG